MDSKKMRKEGKRERHLCRMMHKENEIIQCIKGKVHSNLEKATTGQLVND